MDTHGPELPLEARRARVAHDGHAVFPRDVDDVDDVGGGGGVDYHRRARSWFAFRSTRHHHKEGERKRGERGDAPG